MYLVKCIKPNYGLLIIPLVLGVVINTNNISAMNNNKMTDNINVTNDVDITTINEDNITRDKVINILKTIKPNNNMETTSNQIKLIQILSKKIYQYTSKNLDISVSDTERDLFENVLDYSTFTDEVMEDYENNNTTLTKQCYANLIAVINYCYKNNYISNKEYQSILNKMLQDNVEVLCVTLHNEYYDTMFSERTTNLNKVQMQDLMAERFDENLQCKSNGIYGFIDWFSNNKEKCKIISQCTMYFIKQLIYYLAKTEAIALLSISNNIKEVSKLITDRLEIYKRIIIDGLYNEFDKCISTTMNAFMFEETIKKNKEELKKYSTDNETHKKITNAFGFDKIFKDIIEYIEPRQKIMYSECNKVYNRIGKQQYNNNSIKNNIRNQYIFKDIVNFIPQPKRDELMRKLRENPKEREKLNEKHDNDNHDNDNHDNEKHDKET